MMAAWLPPANAAGWRRHTHSRGSVRRRRYRVSSVMREHASLRSSGGKKNTLRDLREEAWELVRSRTPADTRSVVWGVSHLPRRGGAAALLPPVPCGETRALGIAGREHAPHGPLCPLRRPGVRGGPRPDQRPRGGVV